MLYQILFTGNSSLDDMIRRKLLLFVVKLILEGYGKLLLRGTFMVCMEGPFRKYASEGRSCLKRYG